VSPVSPQWRQVPCSGRCSGSGQDRAAGAGAAEIASEVLVSGQRRAPVRDQMLYWGISSLMHWFYERDISITVLNFCQG
jgi:hypothetical protein